MTESSQSKVHVDFSMAGSGPWNGSAADDLAKRCNVDAVELRKRLIRLARLFAPSPTVRLTSVAVAAERLASKLDRLGFYDVDLLDAHGVADRCRAIALLAREVPITTEPLSGRTVPIKPWERRVVRDLRALWKGEPPRVSNRNGDGTRRPNAGAQFIIEASALIGHPLTAQRLQSVLRTETSTPKG